MTEKLEKLAAIIPCYNAGHRLGPVLEQALPLVRTVCVVDDGSTDGGIEAVRALPADFVTLPHNRGKGHALLAGIGHVLDDPAIEAVCLLDADGQHDPNEIPGLWRAFREAGADLAIGARQFDGVAVPWRSRFGNTVTATVTARLLGTRLPDTQCGFRILGRRFARDVLETVRPGRYETEMEVVIKAVRQGYTVVSAPIATRYEPGNPSSHFRQLSDSVRVYARLFHAARKWRNADTAS